jgi:hypothetical protein
MLGQAWLKYATSEQRKHVSMLGNMAQEVIRNENADEGEILIPQGVRLANLIVDMRFNEPLFHSCILIQAKEYHNRYRWILDGKKMAGLIGWNKASREVSQLVRPIIKGQY